MSALVGEFLASLSDNDAEFARLEAQQREVTAEVRGFRARDRLSRDEVHARALR
ncbi:MAG TPA: hypothetical protein VFJ19_03420 [Nocardioidaceae bacterium]|nr:hypothetical protein [Nocardioidaceae bacterium]